MGNKLNFLTRLFDNSDLSEKLILVREDGRHISMGYNIEIAHSVLQYDYNHRPRSIDLRSI